jgi:hypothetical protein
MVFLTIAWAFWLTAIMALQVDVFRSLVHLDGGVHGMAHLPGVGEGATGQHRHPRARFKMHLHVDLLAAALLQQTKADAHRLIDFLVFSQGHHGADSIVIFLGIHLKSGHQMKPQDLITVDFDVRDLRVPDAGFADAVVKGADQFLATWHAFSPRVGFDDRRECIFPRSIR